MLPNNFADESTLDCFFPVNTLTRSDMLLELKSSSTFSFQLTSGPALSRYAWAILSTALGITTTLFAAARAVAATDSQISLSSLSDLKGLGNCDGTSFFFFFLI